MQILSIVTVSHNNFLGLKNIYRGLKNYLGPNVNWIIQDSGSCTATSNFFKSLSSTNVCFDNSGDDGIYDALNKAVLRANSYYLVVGSDDDLFSHKIPLLIEKITELEGTFDILACAVFFDRKLLLPKSSRFMPIISLRGWITSHSVGTVIRKEIHSTAGYYDTRFTILADSHFLTNCFLQDRNRVAINNLIMGRFNTGGVSTTDNYKRADEAYKYHIDLNYNKHFQNVLRWLRRTKYFILK